MNKPRTVAATLLGIAMRAADRLIELLQSDSRFKVHKLPNGTSTFFLTVSGVAPEVLAQRAARKGVIVPARASNGMIPLQVNATILRMPPAALAQVFVDSMVS